MPPRYLLTPGQVAKVGHLPFSLEVAGLQGSVAPGNVFYVSSVLAVGNGQGTKASPYATLTLALAAATADNGDLIYLLPGHVETVTAAAGIAINKAGVSILGLGNGVDRPTFTFTTSTAATMTLTAASVTMKGVVLVCGLNAVVSPLVVSGADCTLDIETQDGSATVEFLRAILTTAGAVRFTCKLTHRGFVAGTSAVNAIRLVGCVGGRIDVDYYGILTTAVVEFLTTACANVEVTGRFYVSGLSNFSRTVVDTVTGSLWDVRGYDAVAGQFFGGGNAVPVSADPDHLEKAAASATAVLTNNGTLFTITGGPIEILSLVAVCIATNAQAAATTLQWRANPTVGAAATFTGASASLAGNVAGDGIVLNGTALTTAPDVSSPAVALGPVHTRGIIVPAGTIQSVVAVGPSLSTWTHYLRYRPLGRGVTVV